MRDVKLTVPPPPPPPPADMASEQKLYLLNALQVVDKWSVHDDGDGRLFYYDCNTDSSQWEVPEDLASLETEFMMKLMLQNAVARSGVWTAHDTGNGTLYYFNSKTRESVWERPNEWGMAEAAGAEEREKERMAAIANRMQEEEKREKVVKKEKKHKKKKHKEKRDEKVELKEKEEEVPLTEEEMQAEEKRKEHEQKRIEQFRSMLRDKNIMPFCKWSVALPQIAGDPRFVGVPTMDERRAIFEHFVEHRREDLKVEKKNKLKLAKQAFTHLLREQFQLDSWEPSITLSMFLSNLESQIDSERYKQIQDDALLLLTLSAQEKVYAKAITEYKSESLKRDGEQLRLTKFLENNFSALTKPAMRWESDDVQRLVRKFYSSAASNGGSRALLSEEKQKLVFDELVSRLTRSDDSTREEEDKKQPKCSNSREHAQSKNHKRSNSSLQRELRRSHHDRGRSRSHSRSRHRRSRSDSRSHSRGRDRGHRSRRSRRRHSVSSSRSRSRSRSRERRATRRSSRHHRHYSSSPSRSHSRPRE